MPLERHGEKSALLVRISKLSVDDLEAKASWKKSVKNAAITS
jgi:hypothetical protein